MDNKPLPTETVVQAWICFESDNDADFYRGFYDPPKFENKPLKTWPASILFRSYRACLESNLYSIQRQPEKIATYFKARYTQYAAS
jgi:hypothetical protein